MFTSKRNRIIFLLIGSIFISLCVFFTYSFAFSSSTASTTKKQSISKEQTSKPVNSQHAYKEQNKPISISFTGDILLDKSVGENIKKNGVNYPFLKVSPILKKADITAGNLETSVSLRGKATDKQFTFRSRPETLQGLVNSGYDMVGLANNHTLDYGFDALADTITNLKKYKLGYSGAGGNEQEAFRAYSTTVKGKRVSIISVSRVLPSSEWFARGSHAGIAHAYEDEPMMTYVKNTVAHSDYTVVMVHWNRERMDYPEPYARELAKKFIDAGVAAVIGGHSHSLMGIEYYKQVPIFYSLGNFVFTNSSSSKGYETMIVNLTLNKKMVDVKITPAKIIEGQPNLMGNSYNQYIINKISDLSYNAKVNANGTVEQTK